MERYKKRTIALCLASLLTVVGSFGAENYNNTLMELKVNVGSGGFVNLTAFTEKPYDTPIKTSKIDGNTYVLTLKDTNNSAPAPSIKNYENIESIQISTYPYTTESDGCTRIVVKTKGEPVLSASPALFIADNTKFSSQEQYENDVEEEIEEEEEENLDTAEENETPVNNQEENPAPAENTQQTFTPPDYSPKSSIGTSEYLTILLCGSILLLLIGFIFMFSKDKMAAVVGKQDELDVDDKNNKQSKTKKLKSAINKLDKTYSGKKTFADLSYSQSNEDENDLQENANEEQEEVQNVVDLDILFQESQKPTETSVNQEGSDDLADLLSSFMTEFPTEENNNEKTEEEQEAFDEELYNKVINSIGLKFSNEDVNKINTLMQLELSQETLENIKKYVTTPVKKTRTKEQVLADLISTYSIKQNITFSHEDVVAIQKLMSVELGPDFTKDFTTNPDRTKIVEKEIKERTGKNPHRTSKVITLSVKDMLPDLSKELEKQKGKSIKYEAKANTVYFSEGYEYKKLQVPNSLSVISADQSENEYKPSYEAPIVETGYEVPTLTIEGDLPDLADAKANPDKYVHKKEKQTVDESELLKSIANVTFKPFYEDTDSKANPFDDIESDDYNEKETKEEPVVVETNTQINNPVRGKQIKKETRNDENAKKLLELIEAQKTERELKKQAAEDSALFKKELEAAVEKNKKQAEKENKTPKSYSYNGANAELIKTVKCTENSECKIIHTDNKYVVMGNINNKEVILKEYTDLKNSNMYVRLNDKFDKTKYLVKVGLNKFLIQITNDNMEFVMDLC